MSAMASQITSPAIVYNLFGRRSNKTSSSASLAFVRGTHRRPVNCSHNGQVTQKMYTFDDVIIYLSVSWSGKLNFENDHLINNVCTVSVSASLAGPIPEFFWAGKLHSANSGLRWITSGLVHTDNALIKILLIVLSWIWCSRPLCLHAFGRYLNIGIRYFPTVYPSRYIRLWMIDNMVSNEFSLYRILLDTNMCPDILV